jgi:predicted nucleic acid-binding Zn ribbon protein
MARTLRKGKPTRVSEAVAGYLKRAGIAERVAQADVVIHWADMVGERIAKHAKAESITADGTLFVEVKSAAWRQELSLMTPDIMARINAGRRTGRVEKIRWVLGG